MKTLVLLLTLWNADPDLPQVFVMGADLTPQACFAGMQALDPMALDVGGSVSCEFDLAGEGHDAPESVLTAFPPCQYEDSDNCYWDAQARGNGRGTSFYSVYGETLPVVR